eukprot:306465-Prymnesium_polylepis.1
MRAMRICAALQRPRRGGSLAAGEPVVLACRGVGGGGAWRACEKSPSRSAQPRVGCARSSVRADRYAYRK